MLTVARAPAATAYSTRASGRTGAWARSPPPTSTTAKVQCAAVGALPSLLWKLLDTLAANVTVTEHLAVELLHAMCLAGFTIELPAVVIFVDSSVYPCMLPNWFPITVHCEMTDS